MKLMNKIDWLWALAFPHYLLIGTLRHEMLHAVVAALEGSQILEIVFWPTLNAKGGIQWGYVRWQEDTNWLCLAAPYFCDLLIAIITLIILMLISMHRHWLWINLMAIGLASPIVNSTFNYILGSDGVKLRAAIPPMWVHGYFLITIFFYIGALGLVLLRS